MRLPCASLVHEISVFAFTFPGRQDRAIFDPDLDGLKKLAEATLNDGKFSTQEQADFESGARPLTDLGITLSPSVRDYLSLGRFRDALIVHEEQMHPSENLARFIKENDLAETR